MRNTIASALLFAFCACGSTSTPDLLEADFALAGASQIDLQSPKSNAAADENASLVWSARNGVRVYVLEISESESFSSLVLRKEVAGTEYTIANADLVGISRLKPIAHYWRVSTKSKKYPLTSKTYVIQIMSKDVVYASSSSSNSLQLGNQTAPYKTIGAAISQASVTGQPNVYVAQGTYNEDVAMKSNIKVYGGHHATTWQRDTSVNTSTIVRQGVAAVQCGNVTNGTVDGFQIQIGTGGTIYGVYLVSCQATISGNTFVNTGGTTIYGLYQESSSTASISGNTFTLTNSVGSSTSYAVYLKTSAINVSQNNFSLTHTAASGIIYGIYADATTSVTATSNTINGNAGSTSTIFGIYANAGTLLVESNIISGTGYDIRGVITNGANVTATANTFTATADTVSGILISNATGSNSVSGNTATVAAGIYSGQAFYFSGNASSSYSATNNQVSGYCDADCYGIDIGGGNQITANNNTVLLSATQNGVLFGLRSIASATMTCEYKGNLIMTAGYTQGYSLNIANSTGATVVTNNILASSLVNSGFPHFGLPASGVVTFSNNTVVMLTASSNQQFGFSPPTGILITNNIFVTAGGLNTVMVREPAVANDPRSIENNAFWDLAGATRAHFGNFTSNTTCAGGMTCYADLTFESLTDWTGGTDKARGNIELTDGATGNPFVNIPGFIDEADFAGTTTTVHPAVGTPYTNGNCIEINRDGIMRTITAGGGTTTLTFSPAMSGATKAGMEIRNWKSNCSNANISFKLQQNTLSTVLWQNLIYGGKNTSGSNCGAPGGGPGVGAGGESCGTVTIDRDSASRTTANSGLATNTGAGGFSIGAYEKEN